MGDKLEYARRHLHPEVQEDAGGEELLLLGVAGGVDVLQVDGPQLGEDEGVEEAAHVDHAGLALLGKPHEDDLNMIGNVTRGLQGDGLAGGPVPGGGDHGVTHGAQQQPGEEADVRDAVQELLTTLRADRVWRVEQPRHVLGDLGLALLR